MHALKLPAVYRTEKDLPTSKGERGGGGGDRGRERKGGWKEGRKKENMISCATL